MRVFFTVSLEPKLLDADLKRLCRDVCRRYALYSIFHATPVLAPRAHFDAAAARLVLASFRLFVPLPEYTSSSDTVSKPHSYLLDLDHATAG